MRRQRFFVGVAALFMGASFISAYVDPIQEHEYYSKEAVHSVESSGAVGDRP
ncbi:hypothetical protein [Dermatophilus congolensis]|nr:hypothetical protein [Dermatophilus congolensis]MBO3128471.1 hypothetical protein [Dermatophilus congolensis]MBO3132891.1 hypothetical protein [Dermatophilus congolensis]MBO3132950.1 hypothetical protein [Dermatophilus congolensis]MBO3135187.1 hypothetical protein [Dermatophilus congolensis]MBO3137423.1 hypothetical protein [Dermatophilus congolensis]